VALKARILFIHNLVKGFRKGVKDLEVQYKLLKAFEEVLRLYEKESRIDRSIKAPAINLNYCEFQLCLKTPT
jgi:hypothetical protein